MKPYSILCGIFPATVEAHIFRERSQKNRNRRRLNRLDRPIRPAIKYSRRALHFFTMTE